jgi:hypothetical protein
MVLMRWGMPPPPPGRSAAAVKSSDCKTCEDNAVESAPSVGNGVTVAQQLSG